MNQFGDTADCKSAARVTDQDDFICMYIVETQEMVCFHDVMADACKAKLLDESYLSYRFLDNNLEQQMYEGIANLFPMLDSISACFQGRSQLLVGIRQFDSYHSQRWALCNAICGKHSCGDCFPRFGMLC